MSWKTILLITLLIEFITIFGRFFFKISSKDILHKLMRRYGWRRVIHFHHGFTGVIVIFVAVYLELVLFLSIGLGLLFSDIIHHFVVLWFIVGDPEFHIVYNNHKDFDQENKREDRKIRRFFKRAFAKF